MTIAHINRIATAVPPHDVHQAFIDFATDLVPEGTSRNLFKRMARLSGIAHRYSFVEPVASENGAWKDAEQVYEPGNFPITARRMKFFESFAPRLARTALDNLALTEDERNVISHVVVTSCTGLYAPGLDFEVVNYLGLNPSVERTMIGFMGCYAAINALKAAHHIVRSEPDAHVLVLNLELCSLHFQETDNLEQVLSFLVFADGCAASIVSADPQGLAIDSFLAVSIPATNHLITWRIGELGFDMHLSGQVPGEIGAALSKSGTQITRGQRSSLHRSCGPFIPAAGPSSILSKKGLDFLLRLLSTLEKSCRIMGTCRRRPSCSFCAKSCSKPRPLRPAAPCRSGPA